VIFVKYREVSTRRYYQISSAIAETALYLRFGRGISKREKEEAYVKEACVEEAHFRQALSCFDLILLANQNNSPGQPKESLRVATAVRYNYYVQGGNMNGSDGPPC
jgi:hypothetical protein